MKTSSLFNHKTVLSLEILPPKGTTPVDTIHNAPDELRGITLDFISITYGAGGSENSQATLKIVSAIKHKYDTGSVAHIPYLNLAREGVLLILEQLEEQKIGNIPALRRDRVPDGEPVGGLRYASDLVGFIKLHRDFNIIGTCYPEDYQESDGLVRDVKHLEDKVDASVSQLITQFFFSDEYFYHFRKQMDLMRIHVPMEARTMPVVNEKQIERMVSLCGAKLPEEFISVMERYGDNPIAMRDAGITYVVDQIVDLVAGGVDGIHLYIMNDPYIAGRIYESVPRLMASQCVVYSKVVHQSAGLISPDIS